ncbi:MAG: TlpA family protein disulfide reductase [Acidobacteria bacterium]|nr:TlpA family protein disulfide reductase [Acidobacteriota bacterium]
MRSLSIRLGGVLCALALGLGGCAPKAASAPQEQDQAAPSVKEKGKRNQAAEFELKDASGKVVKLSDYRGKVVLLNFWATWCGPCKIEIPWFKDFQKTYKDRGFTVLGVSMDEDGWEAVKPYIAEKELNYPVVLGTEEVDQKYGGIEGLPTTFILDRDGKIAAVHVGLVSKKQYADDIEQLLQ